MAFCTNCGHQLADGAKFCYECGTKVDATVAAQGEQRRVVYEGEIHKCPNCGEVLNSFVAICPACGLELRGTKNTSSLTNFVSKLEKAKTEDQQISIIRNQPIPNSKEDVMEFMLLAINNISGTNSSDIRIAWQTKLDQIHQKASMILPEADMAQVNALYEETVKKVRTHDIVQGTKATGRAVGYVASGLGAALLWMVKQLPAVLVFIAKNILSLLSIAAYLKAIQIDRLGENGVGYELVGWVLSITSALLLRRKNVNYFEILFVGCCGGLHFYLANFLENGSGLQLCGAITLILVLVAFIKKVKPSETTQENT